MSKNCTILWVLTLFSFLFVGTIQAQMQIPDVPRLPKPVKEQKDLPREKGPVDKWNGEGRLFLALYSSLSQKSAGDAIRTRIMLEDEFGLCSQWSVEAKGNQDYIPVIVGFSGIRAVEKLRQSGFVVRLQGKNFCTGLMPLSKVNEITSIEEIHSIHLGQKKEPDIDQVKIKSKVNEVQEEALENGFSQAYTGDGVVVGIVDGGFDFAHPSFFGDPTDNSTYRVSRVWDQKATEGTAPEGYGYGVEYTTTDQILSAVHSEGGGTHGTHVAAMAAGSYANDEISYKGVAPDAEIVMVSTTFYGSDILDGVKYIQDYARSQGKPSVVNLSLGSPLGPHDGSTLEDIAYNHLVTPGNFIVVSAGNSGGGLIHIGEELGEDDYRAYGIQFISDQPAFFDFYDRGEGSILVFALYDSTGKLYNDPIRGEDANYSVIQVGIGSDFQSSVITYEGDTLYKIDSWKGYGPEYMQSIVSMSQLKHAPSGYFPVLLVQPLYEGMGTSYHAWCSEAEFRGLTNFLSNGDDRYTISGSMGPAQNVLTVAAYVTKNTWTTEDGATYGVDETVGDIAGFSSKGPRVDGYQKPDIAAPGCWVVSAASSYYPPDKSLITGYTENNGRSYPWAAMQGTSMSSPAMAGMVALMLQQDSNLDRERLTMLLKQTSGRDSYVEAGGPDSWGYGKADVSAVLRNMEDGIVNDYYADARGKNGMELKEALHQIIASHTPRTLEQIKEDIQLTDVHWKGHVWDIYSSEVQDWNWVESSQEEGGGICLERVFPASWFGNDETSPAYTDLFQVYPVDRWVASQRKDYLYGKVRVPDWEGSMSKSGENGNPGYVGKVFEPSDQYKGDIARTCFYMVTRYQDQLSQWSSPVLDGSTGYSLSPWVLDMLLEWHETDPVSDKERDRNRQIYEIQGNRNPFIDNPQWVDSIWRKPREVVEGLCPMITEYMSGNFNGLDQCAIEIYNPTDEILVLEDYCLKFEKNGMGGFEDSLNLKGILMPKSCYVVAKEGVQDGNLLYADLLDGEHMKFDGNDAVALFCKGEMVDVVGFTGSLQNWGKDVILRRKLDVTSPSREYKEDEWLKFGDKLTGDLGYHGAAGHNPTMLMEVLVEDETHLLLSFSRDLSADKLVRVILYDENNEREELSTWNVSIEGKRSARVEFQTAMEPNTVYVVSTAETRPFYDCWEQPVVSLLSFLSSEEVTYRVDIRQNEGGKIYVYKGYYTVESGEIFEEGTELKFKAVADPGYVFFRWWNGNTTQIFDMSLYSDIEVSAEFKKEDVASEPSSELSCRLWPNPSEGKFWVEIGKDCQMSVYDALGQEVLRYGWVESGKHELDMEAFGPGVYFLRLQNGTDNRILKLVIR